MKNTVLTGALCLVLGIAIGWIAKPKDNVTNEAPGSSLAKASPAATPSPSARIVDSPILPSKAIRPMDDEEDKKPAFTMSGPSPAMQERFQKMVIDQAKKKSSDKVADLAEKLGLNTEQTARLQAYFDDKIAGITDDPDDPDDEDGYPDMLALAKLQSNQSIDTALTDILTDEQSAAYEELKTNERNRQVESRAYKDLARVNTVLDLSDDQKNAVYDILYEDAGRKIDKADDSGSAMAMIMGGHGIDIDVDDIAIGGIGSVVEGALDSEGNPSPMSQEDLMKNMREQNQNRIDEKVERLAPVLTPEQTEQYRKHLESKSSGMFQNMLIDGEGDAPTGVFKIETSISE